MTMAFTVGQGRKTAESQSLGKNARRQSHVRAFNGFAQPHEPAEAGTAWDSTPGFRYKPGVEYHFLTRLAFFQTIIMSGFRRDDSDIQR
jgi:hypothetical protein